MLMHCSQAFYLYFLKQKLFWIWKLGETFKLFQPSLYSLFRGHNSEKAQVILDSECAKSYSKSSGNPFNPETGETEVGVEA